MKLKSPALGRGLDALITSDPVQTEGTSSINEIAIDLIDVNPNQPRSYFDEEALTELSDSIRELGVVQPITLREMPGGRYQIVAGERRYRASKLAGLSKIPAYVKSVDDRAMLEMALVENIQREDLNAIEIALCYQNLMDCCKCTQEQLADRVGKKRATVTNYLRLLKLPAEVQLGIKDKKIDMGHARALVSVDNPITMIRLYEETVQNGYSVRKLEEIIHKRMNPSDKKPVATNNDYKPLCDNLSQLLSTSVSIVRNAQGKGCVKLAFSSDAELEKLLAVFDRLH